MGIVQFFSSSIPYRNSSGEDVSLQIGKGIHWISWVGESGRDTCSPVSLVVCDSQVSVCNDGILGQDEEENKRTSCDSYTQPEWGRHSGKMAARVRGGLRWKQWQLGRKRKLSKPAVAVEATVAVSWL